MPLSERLLELLLLVPLVALFLSWPVFFFLIRRRTLKTGKGARWHHAAFLLGPLGAAVIFLWFAISDRQKRS